MPPSHAPHIEPDAPPPEAPLFAACRARSSGGGQPPPTPDADRGGGSWRAVRQAKLEAQRPAAISALFAGLSFYLNGRTFGLLELLSHHELKRLLQQHGATVTMGPSVRALPAPPPPSPFPLHPSEHPAHQTPPALQLC